MEEVMRMRANRVSFDYDIPITPDPSDSEFGSDAESTVSSHEEYVPSSCKKNVRTTTTEHASRSQRKPCSPTTSRTVTFANTTNEIWNNSSKPVVTDNSANDSSVNDNSVRFEAEDDNDEFENVILNESIMKFLREDGISLAQQQQEFRRYNRKKSKSTKRSSSSTDEEVVIRKDFINGFHFLSSDDSLIPENINGYHPSFDLPSTSSCAPVIKRRISIQNEVSPIRNKDSPPEVLDSGTWTNPGKSGPRNRKKAKRRKSKSEKWIVTAKPTEIVVTPKSISKKEPEEEPSPRKTRSRSRKSSPDLNIPVTSTRATRSGSKRSSPETEVEIQPAKKPKIEEESEDDEVICSETISPSTPSISAAMVKIAQMKQNRNKTVAKRKPHVAQTRRVKSRCDTQSWDWGEVLLRHPDRISRRK